MNKCGSHDLARYCSTLHTQNLENKEKIDAVHARNVDLMVVQADLIVVQCGPHGCAYHCSKHLIQNVERCRSVDRVHELDMNSKT